MFCILYTVCTSHTDQFRFEDDVWMCPTYNFYTYRSIIIIIIISIIIIIIIDVA